MIAYDRTMDILDTLHFLRIDIDATTPG